MVAPTILPGIFLLNPLRTLRQNPGPIKSEACGPGPEAEAANPGGRGNLWKKETLENGSIFALFVVLCEYIL